MARDSHLHLGLVLASFPNHARFCRSSSVKQAQRAGDFPPLINSAGSLNLVECVGLDGDCRMPEISRSGGLGQDSMLDICHCETKDICG